MTTFSEQVTIKAPIDKVWAELADIGNICVWNPGVVASHLTGDQHEDVGAKRFCDLGKNIFLDESVVDWEEQSKLTMRIDKTNLPFKSADIRFTLEQQGDKTLVTVSPIYKLKFGVLGKAMDAMFIKRSYSKGMRAMLGGLKKHLEQ